MIFTLRLRVQVAAPRRLQNTLDDVAHNTLALQRLHCSISHWFQSTLLLYPRATGRCLGVKHKSYSNLVYDVGRQYLLARSVTGGRNSVQK